MGRPSADATGTPDDNRLRELMVSYQAGDLAAFDRLYALLLPAVRGFVRRRVTDPGQADDLVQEAFLQFHRARRTYDPRHPVTPWAMAIARHVWLMHCRRAGRRPFDYAQGRPRATEHFDESYQAVRAGADTFAEQSAVRAALASLPPDRRRPLVWHHVLGFSFREIAARLGIREDAAKLRSSRGMKALRARLGVSKGGGERDE